MASAPAISQVTRRTLLKRWLAASSVAFGAGVFCPAVRANDALLPGTPSCGPDDGPTRASTEGPFYRDNPPQKRDFRTDAPGLPVTLIGYVLTRDCRPVKDAIVDLWHANQDGEYDNRGFKLRGYQTTDDQGRYSFETIRPAQYAGRTPHYHVKVHPPDGRTLTTQLYFPDEQRNQRDFLFNDALLMDMQPARDGEIGRFDFVLG